MYIFKHLSHSCGPLAVSYKQSELQFQAAMGGQRSASTMSTAFLASCFSIKEHLLSWCS